VALEPGGRLAADRGSPGEHDLEGSFAQTYWGRIRIGERLAVVTW
jgi:hypothetical protein